MDVKKEVLEMLLKFLKMATGDRATDKEIELIPEVAKILLDYSEYSEISTLSAK